MQSKPLLSIVGLGLLALACFPVGHSTPQNPPNPFVDPEPAAKPIVDDYKPTVEMPNVVKPKPVAKGHYEKRYIEGAWRFVWFADGVKKAPAVQKQMSGGNCAGGNCYSPARRGWGRRR